MAGQIMDKSIINNCLGFLKTFKSSDVWITLQDYWKMYQKKQYNKGNDVQDDEGGGCWGLYSYGMSMDRPYLS